jgi:formylglycine-generating enzyme required for sulfatase activity
MGLSKDDETARSDEHPPIKVNLTHGFWLGKYEVTQKQWKQLMETEPWKGKNFVQEADDNPASWIGWDDARGFCRRLTEMERKANRLPDGWEYRLPTEAQWEYACRAGSTTLFYFGDDKQPAPDHAWCEVNVPSFSDKRYPRAVGQKLPNPWGFYDILGNVQEACLDWYGSRYYGTHEGRAATDPAGPDSGEYRVSRGGYWANSTADLRSASRGICKPEEPRDPDGLRVALVQVAD